MEFVPHGYTVTVLGTYDDYVLVEREDGLRGWLRSSILGVSGPASAGGR